MQILSFLFVAATCVTLTMATEATPAAQPMPSAPSQPAYQPQDSTGYVPHATYPYSDSYGSYDGYLMPAIGAHYSAPKQNQNLVDTVVPTAQQILATSIRFLARMGLFVLGGIGLLLVGGLFTTAICSLTQICTIEFQGLGLNRESMRALVTPDRVANAAAFVENAVEKYARLQRAIK